MSARILITILAIATLANCGGPPPDTSGRPHILLITLDSLRPDHLGTYGYNRPTSPFIDQLAREGTVWTKAYTSTAGTTASHATLLSGLYQETHRVALDPQAELRARTEVPWGLLLLPGTLKQHGYRTVAVTDGGNASRAFGFAGAFDDFDDDGGGALSGARELARMIARGQKRGRPIFAWFQTYEIHPPWPDGGEYEGLFGTKDSRFDPTTANLLACGGRLAPEDLQLIQDRYDAGIHRTDLALRELFAELRRTGFLDTCITVITAAHGETFGEHGALLARDKLYEELIHVPLVIWGRNIPAGNVVHGLIGSADIPPTLLMQAGLPIPELMKGRDLFGTSRSNANTALVVQYGNECYAVRTRSRKLISYPAAGRREMFDLYRDPGELDNLVYYYPEAVRPYDDRLVQWREQHGSSGMVDREEARLSGKLAEQLKSLLGPAAAGAGK
jgi:arylsulfatase A-like enzyme